MLQGHTVRLLGSPRCGLRVPDVLPEGGGGVGVWNIPWFEYVRVIGSAEEVLGFDSCPCSACSCHSATAK